METTESKAILILLGYMYFTDISIVNSGVREAYAHVYHLVQRSNKYAWCYDTLTLPVFYSNSTFRRYY